MKMIGQGGENKVDEENEVISKPREGWEKVFKAMHENGDDTLLIEDTLQDGDEEWEW